MNCLYNFRFTLIWSIFFSLFLFSCGEKKQDEAPSSEMQSAWELFISSHTQGMISREGKVRIQFNKDLVEEEKVGKEFQGELDFEPDITGTVTWTARNELLFESEEHLEPGVSYIASLASDNLPGIPADLSPFKFHFKIMEQSLNLQIGGFSPVDTSDLSKQTLTGTIYSTDIADTTKFEEVIQAHQYKKDLKVSWSHSENRKEHKFTIHNIARGEKRGHFILDADGSELGVKDLKFSKKIPIPSLKEFLLMSIASKTEQNQFIELQFSDPLSSSQDLSGLIRVGSLKNLRFEPEGTKVRVYFQERVAGSFKVSVDKSIQNILGADLSQGYTRQVSFTLPKPAIKLEGKGVILPANKIISMPFEAVSLKSVKVKALEVFPENIGQFLQVNRLNGGSEIHRVGRYLWEKTIPLEKDGSAPMKWTRYNLDLSELVKTSPGSMFRLEMSFGPDDSGYPCQDSMKIDEDYSSDKRYDNLGNWNTNAYQEDSHWDYYGGWYGDTRWSNRDNPCKQEYYDTGYNNQIEKARNFIGSDIGLIAKSGDIQGPDNALRKRLLIASTKISTAEILSGTRIQVLNFQNREIGSGVTNGEGFADIELSGVPFYLRAEHGNDVGYLKLNEATALAASHFDIGGVKSTDGLKGYLYGERGVWRPGDSLFLTFVLQDPKGEFPKDHPIHFELKNPRGKSVEKKNFTSNTLGFYSIPLVTAPDAETGNYTAIIKAGGLVVQKRLKIETVIPNRLKIKLDFNKKELTADDQYIQADLFSQWLHGAKASKLKADVSVNYTAKPASFARYSDYEFNDPTRKFSSSKSEIFSGYLDEEGNAKVNGSLEINSAPAGMLKAKFLTRVHETSGGFSSQRFSIPLHPYRTYVGIKLPKGDQARSMLLTDTLQTVDIAAVQPYLDGDKRKTKGVSTKVRVRLMKINWRWWWDKKQENLSRYSSDSYHSSLKDTVIHTDDGHGTFQFQINYPSWGRYLITACHVPDGGAMEDPYDYNHCTGKPFYIDWPGWAGKAREESGVGATMLSVTTDKKSYKTGDKAQIRFPAGPGSRALVSLETSSEILESFWVEADENSTTGQSQVEITIDERMSPNVYAHVSLVQPHQGKTTDRPIRTYGITPIYVEDPGTILKPRIEAPEEVSPGGELKVEVSEKDGKAMAYTLAIVDEGLLGLTRFKTPELRKIFYKKEALGIKTWDIYDFVVGSYGQELERLLALGGDDDGLTGENANQNRFPPLVRYYGPFHLKKGDETTHKIPLPEYVGAVRAMVIAGTPQPETQTEAFFPAYGSAEKSIFVRKALMVQSLLPRVLGPDDELEIPITVFAMNESVKKVHLKVTAPELTPVDHNNTLTVNFSKPGEQVIFLKYKTPKSLGEISYKLKASGGGVKAEETINIKVRSPNQLREDILDFTIPAGKSITGENNVFGLEHSNSAWLELSSFPPINLENRLSYLIGYPHGCVEQTTSRAFPQVFLPKLVQLEKSRTQEVQSNVRAAIHKMQGFQHNSGGFGYWPGHTHADDWSSTYAGHFLIHAQKAGYSEVGSMLNSWASHQKTMSSRWWQPQNQWSTLGQAYRLYTLALYGQPALSDMNRLREYKKLKDNTLWLLAAGYALAGQAEAAAELAGRASIDLEDYASPGETYGSRSRDEAIALIAITHMAEVNPDAYQAKAETVVKKLSETLGSTKWMSTQSTAWSLSALSIYYSSSDASGGIDALVTVDGKDRTLSAKKSILLHKLSSSDKSTKFSIQNKGARTLYARSIQRGIPLKGEEKESAQGLKVQVSFQDAKGNALTKQQIANRSQGNDFVAWITVKNTGTSNISDVALTQIFPSGWEIRNMRFDAGESYADGNDKANTPEYEDIRDDRIHLYFPLKRNEQKRFPVYLHATYPGTFYLSGAYAESMYRGDIHGSTKGMNVTVQR